MKEYLHQITSKGISKIEYSGDPGKMESQNEYWLEFKIKSEDSLVEKLKDYDFDSRVLSQIEHPAESKNIIVSSQTIVIHLIVSKSKDIYQSDFLTVLLRPGLLVTIIDETNNLLNDFEEEINNIPFDQTMDLNYAIYFMINFILQQSTENVKQAREIVDQLSMQMDDKPEDLEMSDIIYAKYKIHTLANIIEDQYITLELIPKFNWSGEVVEIENELAKVVKRFDFLRDMTNRLEEKIRGLHLQYQLVLQESGNKRLNTLTVIQAIFVPLTLIAGIYGMNFLVMPELTWTSGYFIILGVMLFIAVGELWLFKRHGWFD